MKLGIEFSRKLSLAYESMCKPLCHELKLPQTAFDILMFLANNPEFKTARDIVEVRKLKANLVSVNIDKLVNEGYLIRKNVEGDRRKVQLLCTDKAQPIISRGKQLQEHFVEQLFADIDDATRQTIFQGMQQMELNLNLDYVHRTLLIDRTAHGTFIAWAAIHRVFTIHCLCKNLGNGRLTGSSCTAKQIGMSDTIHLYLIFQCCNDMILSSDFVKIRWTPLTIQ